jgi:hypothetical protein
VETHKEVEHQTCLLAGVELGIDDLRARGVGGDDLVLDRSHFAECLLPLRNIDDEAMDVHRRYFAIPGPTRQPMLTWTHELPIAGDPADLAEVVESYAAWRSESPIPKLFVDATPPRASSSMRSAAHARPADGHRRRIALRAGRRAASAAGVSAA